MNDPTVLQAKRYGILSCQPTDSLQSVAERMKAEQISTLVVTDEEGYLAGIITRTDLLRAGHESVNWGARFVSEFMKTKVITVLPSDRLSKVTQLLLENNIHRVVVVQKEEQKLRPVAVVAAADLIYHMVQDDNEEF